MTTILGLRLQDLDWTTMLCLGWIYDLRLLWSYHIWCTDDVNRRKIAGEVTLIANHGNDIAGDSDGNELDDQVKDIC